MTVSNGDIVKVIVDFTDANAHHIMNKLTFRADFSGDQTDLAVLTAIVSYVGVLYNQVAAQVSSVLDDPDVEVDKIDWVTDHWEVTDRAGS